MKNIILTTILIGSITIATAQNNLGVNQPNPTAKTHITNTENQNSLQVDDEANDATPFVVDSLGNVGVQTETPQADLDVNGGVKADSIQLTNGATDGAVLTSDANGNASWNEINVAVFQEKYGVQVGLSSVVGWQIRDLNFEKTNIGSTISIDLGLDRISLLPGMYKIVVSAPAYRADGHQIKLVDVSNNQDLLIGTMEFAGQTENDASRSTINDVLEVSITTVFSIEHFFVVGNSFGLGPNYASSTGIDAVMTTIYIEKIK